MIARVISSAVYPSAHFQVNAPALDLTFFIFSVKHLGPQANSSPDGGLLLLKGFICIPGRDQVVRQMFKTNNTAICRRHKGSENLLQVPAIVNLSFDPNIITIGSGRS